MPGPFITGRDTALGLAGRIRPRTIALMGDSITLASDVNSLTVPTYSLTTYGTPAIAAGLRMLRNSGLGGDTAQQNEARFAEILAVSPNIVLIATGTNNVTVSSTDADIGLMMNAIERMVLTALDNNILPIIVTQPPAGSMVVAKKAKVQPFYHWLAEYYGLPLIDIYKYMVEPATGQMKAAYSDDTVHPNEAGKVAVFDYVKSVLTDWQANGYSNYFADYSSDSYNGEFNLLRNGSFALGTTSSLNGWALNLTGDTHTLETTTLPATGRVSKHVIAADGARYLLAGGNFNVTAGDELIVSARAKVSGVAAATGSMGVTLNWVGAGGAATLFSGWVRSFDTSGSLRCIVPTGATAASMTVYVDKAGTYEFSNITVINRRLMATIWQPGVQGV